MNYWYILAIEIALFSVYTLGHNAYGQCGRQIVPGEVFRGNQNVNKLPIDFNIKQVQTTGATDTAYR